MPLFNYKDCEIEYKKSGQGKGLVLVHGLGQNAAGSWPTVFNYFDNCRTVVAPNLSGSGRTKDSWGELTIPRLAEQVVATADQAGLERFELIGHSLGACVALEVAASWPQRVEKLVLLAGFISSADARMQMQYRLWRELAQSDPRRLAELFLFTACSPHFITRFSEQEIEDVVKDIYEDTNWAGAIRQIDLVLTVDMTERLSQVTQPTLVIGCRHDYITPLVYSQELKSALPKAYYEEFDCGHAALYEMPEDFNLRVDRFLFRAITGASS